jgi:hypothetical protein
MRTVWCWDVMCALAMSLWSTTPLQVHTHVHTMSRCERVATCECLASALGAGVDEARCHRGGQGCCHQENGWACSCLRWTSCQATGYTQARARVRT